MKKPKQQPIKALQALDTLRNRIKKLFFIDGMVALGLSLCSVVIATFILDYFLKLPLGVRVILLAIVLAYLVSVVIRRLVRPKQIDLPLEDLAILVESKNPQLKQAFVTAIQLTSPKNKTAQYLSQPMIRSIPL